jgi:cholest-4-en-3-one 26-monooxygenase
MLLEDVDLASPESFVAGVPHESFALLRREDPVHWHKEPQGGPGFWAVTRHDDVVFVSKHPEIFSSARGGTNIFDVPEADMEITRTLLINMDPPQHVKFRRLIRQGFTPNRVKLLLPRVRERAVKLVDGLVAKGEGDFVREVAAELPLQVIAELMGIPDDERGRIFDLSNKLIGFDDPEFQNTMEDGKQAAAEMWLYAHKLAVERKEGTGDDLVSALMRAEVDGHKITELEFNNFFLLLAVAGNETTRNLLSGAVLALIEHPDQWRRLQRDRALLDTAVEEFLRWVTPVMHFRRTATRDVELRDKKILEGQKVVLFYPAANRDEWVFDQPERFDVGRIDNPHLALGIGEHYCMGANLARMEIRVLFEEMLRRVPEFELAGPVRRLRSAFINGIKTMPVRVASDDWELSPRR